MNIRKVTALYFSPTDNTRKVTECLGDALAAHLGVPVVYLDCTLPETRTRVYDFDSSDMLVAGFPVYAGRIPNKILPFLQTGIQGCGATAIPVVTFGNRSFGDGLMELNKELTAAGFTIAAGAALPCEHAFTTRLAAGRPNQDDLEEVRSFASDAAKKIMSGKIAPLAIPGNDTVGPYYTPLGEDGQPAKFLKARPLTDPEKCIHCALCAKKCPMGSICRDDPSQVTGICIKCQSCVRSCPMGAKYFDDERFLSHVAMLEKNFQGHQDNIFVI